MLTKINGLEDVILFIEQVIDEGTNIHPDDDFINYININTNERSYSKAEAIMRNQLMNECFIICNLEKKDIYALTNEVYLKRTGLDRFIPLPSNE